MSIHDELRLRWERRWGKPASKRGIDPAKPRMSISERATLNAKVSRCKQAKAAGLPCTEFAAEKAQPATAIQHDPSIVLPQRHVVISLARRPDRREAAMAQFSAAGITPEIFDAVDGRLVGAPIGFKKGAGAYGCLQSHLRVLEAAMADGIQVLAVYEDDVVLVPNFRARMEQVIRSAPSDWDAILLGGQHLKQPSPATDGFVRAVSCHRTHAYIARGAYIKTLYQIWAASNGHCDATWARHQPQAMVYAPVEWLAGQAATKSDINGRTFKADRWWGGKK